MWVVERAVFILKVVPFKIDLAANCIFKQNVTRMPMWKMDKTEHLVLVASGWAGWNGDLGLFLRGSPLIFTLLGSERSLRLLGISQNIVYKALTYTITHILTNIVDFICPNRPYFKKLSWELAHFFQYIFYSWKQCKQKCKKRKQLRISIYTNNKY